MGQAVTALPGDRWALFSNPALAADSLHRVSFYAVRYYGFTELTEVAASVSFPSRWGTFGTGVYRYGFELFSESRFRLGYSNHFHGFYVGAAATYHHVSQGGGYGSAAAMAFDLGIAASLADRWWIGSKLTNLSMASYDGSGEELPRELSFGLAYRMTGRSLLSTDLVKDVRFPISFRGGIEVEIFNRVTGRAGVTTEPLTYALGLGIRSGFWGVNIAAQRHETLGISPGMDLNLSW